MKLNHFSKENMPQGYTSKRTAEPCISISKNGTFVLNKGACELIEILPGNKIVLSQDSDNPEDWYLSIDNENGFEVRGKDIEKTGCIIFNHTTLQREYINCLGLDLNTTYRFKIAKTPQIISGSKTKYWCVLFQND